MNPYGGYANSINLSLDRLPYVDRLWIGELFRDYNKRDFWLVEMSGIPFGLMSEMLDAHNVFRGMVFGMLPRLPWSGNPVPMWRALDAFGIDQAKMCRLLGRPQSGPQRQRTDPGNDHLPAARPLGHAVDGQLGQRQCAKVPHPHR